MAKIQAYVSDDVVNKINAIVEQRRAEGARKEDVSSSSVISMLVELGLRVYEAQMERKESPFNQMLFNKTLLEAVLKSQFISSKILAMESMSPHLDGNDKFEFRIMVQNIRDDVQVIVNNFFPEELEISEDD
ncbi:relaxosome protein TraM [Enterobacter huaxiensis]|uniref:Relaxosome protein TraM n=1 Tax=Enterobacter huaxiensis TaxID=2494702 RepID=A0A3R9VVR0_9ENTR|nr:conjugal transfer relaxosome DNA-binding protein TraM [Enterobacter huaxiensis]RSK63064.1 relaxosome protein TraM [Enterobacter huaxiensis]UNC52591.1 relaxosome protein TraM [Enterobacter huaxiensis]